MDRMSVGKNLSVAWKFGLPLAVLIVFLLAIVAVVCYLRTVYMIERQICDKGWSLVNISGPISIGYLQSGNIAALKKLLANVALDEDVSYVIIFDATGKALVSDGRQINIAPGGEGGLQSDRASGITRRVGEGKIFDFTVPLRGYVGNNIGWLRLGLHNGKVDSYKEGTVTGVLTILFLSAFAGLMSSWVLVRRIVYGPLSHLKEAAERISTGDFTYQMPVQGMDELGQLAQSFNKVNGYIGNVFKSLQTGTAELSRVGDEILNKLEEMQDAGKGLEESKGAVYFDEEIVRELRKISRLVDKLNDLSLQFRI